jgi:hypothetical protein
MSALIASMRPNQSLKLTEGAVDDFARAKQLVTIGQDLLRADWLRSLRRYSLALVLMPQKKHFSHHHPISEVT